MKILSGGMVLAASSFMILAAAETSIIDFEHINPTENAPSGWYISKIKAFTPLPKVNYLTENGKKIMHVTDIQGESGCRFDCYKLHPVLDGDKFVLIADVKGRGEGTFTVQAYSGKKWMGHIGVKHFPIPGEWKEVRIEFHIRNLADTSPTDSVICLFGAKKGAELFIRSIKVERIAEIAGTTAFPNVWTAFLPMAPEFKPSPTELENIPATLDEVKSRKVQFSGNEHDFAPDFGKPGPLKHGAGNCAWLYAEINTDKEEDYMIGAGADWWMQVNLNGKPVIDTLAKGNELHPPRITDYKTTIRLKKGKNILAVKYITGGGSSILAMGGPNDLRSVGQKLRIVEELCKDDFEKSNISRPGNPRIIQGQANLALVSPTREAMYTASPKLEFGLSQTEYVMPKIASGKYFGTTLRIKDFGSTGYGDAKLSFCYAQFGTDKSCVLEIISQKADKELTMTIRDNGKTVDTFRYQVALLPADILFTVNGKGEYKLSLETLVDSSVRHFNGESKFFAELNDSSFTASATLESLGQKPAQVILDDYCYGYAMPDVIKKLIPMDIHVDKTFDPKKAGWKLIFNDEFEGNEFDRTKWYITSGKPEAIRVHDGILEVNVIDTRTGDKTSYKGAGFSSYQFFQYGYFEARLRFRRHEGWSTAFWLYGGQTGNSFLDGMEIDIYEDYYVTPERPRLDHNFHGFVGRTMKSWNYLSTIPGSLEDFYTIGCKWTPFEITYYMNGKAIPGSANHSPHKTVTYDALNHRIGFAPLNVSFHASPREQYGWGKPIENKGKFPDTFKVDYVRVYAYPHNEDPLVTLTGKDQKIFVNPGEKFDIEANITPNAKTKTPIKGVYLFDSGCLIDYKDKPPYKFTVSIDEKYYSGTNYMHTGRSREVPHLKNVLHAYSIYAQDAKGKIANSEVVLKMTPPEKKSTPYKGKAQAIPGKINPCFYDEGGNGIAYLDDNVNVNQLQKFRLDEGVDATGEWIGNVVTGEWVNMTVDIEKAGKYTVTMDYGAPAGYGGSMLMTLDDDRLLGTFDLPNNRGTGWGGLKSTLKNIELPAGRHVIKLIIIGAFNYSYLSFEPEVGKVID
ncbi:MAG: Beta-glucanase precursor [Lentisphaerae bacterium ADurb.Bin242]|nr:MAG: Beta-glucanase precursor [Lentisphaerae bacterium ADurb.Bin242]